MEFFLMSGPNGGPGMGLMDILILFGPIFLIMYFIVIRPQRKEQRLRQEMLVNLKKGDVVVTHGGLIGKVTRIKDDRIELKVDESNNTKINFLRTAVYSIIKEKESEEKEAEKNEKK